MTPCHDPRLGVTKINGDFLNGFKGPFGNSIIIPALSGLAFLFRSHTGSPTPAKTGRHHYDSTPSAAVPGRAFTGAPAEGGFSTQKTWSIGDSLFRMKIIAQGARESSFELLKFKEELKPDSPPMQMIRDTAYLPLDVELLFHKDWDLYRRPFSSDVPTDIKIAPGEPPRSIPFQTEIPGKVRLTKIFTVQADSYAMDLEIQIQNLSAEKLSDQMGLSFYFKPYSDSAHQTYNQSRLTFSTMGRIMIWGPRILQSQTLSPDLPTTGWDIRITFSYRQSFR